MFTTYESLIIDIVGTFLGRSGLDPKFYSLAENNDIILMPEAKEVLDKCKEKVTKLSKER
jgi:hypothetical protein